VTAVRIEGKSVDVANEKCKGLPCFYLFSDKGTFTPGRGYTSYHKKPRWVCGRRHLNGCPTVAVCKDCHSCVAPYRPDKCGWCGGTNIERKEEPQKESK
jgi:hypothetical protein